MDADVFYFRGFGGGIDAIKNVIEDCTCLPTINQLINRVDSGDLLYIGVCGGAIFAGSCYLLRDPNLPCLDLFHGFDVDYTPCQPALQCPVTLDDTKLQMTSGCGFALNIGEVKSSCFTVLKAGKYKWNDFCFQNNAKLFRQCRKIMAPPQPPPPRSLPTAWVRIYDPFNGFFWTNGQRIFYEHCTGQWKRFCDLDLGFWWHNGTSEEFFFESTGYNFVL